MELISFDKYYISVKLVTVVLLLVLRITISEGIIVQSKFNLTEYYSMPAQYSGDDYVKCMIESDDALWCTGWSIIKPNQSNKIWNLIEKWSNDTKKHYRHDLVQWGICIKWCMDELSELDDQTKEELYEPEFSFSVPYKIDETVFYNATEYRRLYDGYINRCRNKFFKEKYGLRAHSGIAYCVSDLEDHTPDTLDWSFLIIFGLLAMILGLSSLLDFAMNKDMKVSHYESALSHYSLPTRLILAFSVPRNWYRLNSKPKDEKSRDLRYIQGLRFSTIFLVVYGHAVITYGFAPAVNTEYIEEQYYNLIDMLVINGLNVVQTFFAISGFLMGLQFIEMTEHKKFRFSYFWVAIVYRWIRLTPVYAFVIMFEATWQYKMIHGPFWKTVTETEKSFCRRNWWTNLLYVNNYVNQSQMCLIQTWYLAVEFQLFIVGLLVLLSMWRFPKLKNKIFFTVLFITFLIPAIVTYVRKYEGIFTFSPHDKKFIYHPFSDGFINYYIPAHTNAGNYFAGVGTAMLYLKFKREKIDIGKSMIFKVSFYTIFPIGFISFLAAYLFYINDFEKPALWIALFAAISKNIWGLFGAILMLGFTCKVGGLIRRLFCMPVFQTLGRLSYCIFLVHFITFRFLTGDSIALPYLSAEPIILLTCAGFLISCFVATALCITLEFPFTALLKELTAPILKKANSEEEAMDVKVSKPTKVEELTPPVANPVNGHTELKQEVVEENHQTKF